MKVTILCTDPRHPIIPRLEAWVQKWPEHTIVLLESATDAHGGDILFLISCHEKVHATVRQRYRHVLVIHAADLPADRGWSPHVWAVLRGDDELTISLLEAAQDIDSGCVFRKLKVHLKGNEVCHEINNALFDAEISLMDWAMENIDSSTGEIQDESRASYLRRRTAADSELDPAQTIAAQFDLLRVSDPERYPAFFEHRGRKFKLCMMPLEADDKGDSHDE